MHIEWFFGKYCALFTKPDDRWHGNKGNNNYLKIKAEIRVFLTGKKYTISESVRFVKRVIGTML